MTAESSNPGISVVIPTYNRSASLCESLQTCAEVARGLPVEFIVIDDGSRDDTSQQLARLQHTIPNLQWRSIPNGGPGQARNLGASLATKDLVLFLGDDVRPTSDDFFRAHVETHARFPEPTSAVLGKMIWSDRPHDEVNFVMEHIQGLGAQQFGYARMQPFTWIDFRFFYTCNVSVKRALVQDWLTEGFSPAFPIAAFEDVEFAYRMMKRHGQFRIFYTPASLGAHLHEHTVETFLNRQVGAGMMLKVLLDLHPEAADLFHDMLEVVRVMQKDDVPDDPETLASATAVFEGIKGWAKLIARAQKLGSQNWHADFLSAVFQLAMDEGVLLAYGSPPANLTAGRLRALERFRNAMSRCVRREMLGQSQLADAFLFPGQTLTRNRARVKRLVGRVPGAKFAYRQAVRCQARAAGFVHRAWRAVTGK